MTHSMHGADYKLLRNDIVKTPNIGKIFEDKNDGIPFIRKGNRRPTTIST